MVRTYFWQSVVCFIWFYTFDSICFPEIVLIPEILLSISLTDSSLTRFLWFFYDIILFTWFAKRFWIHPFPFNIMRYIANIIKDCCSILFTDFNCSAWMHCCPFTTFIITWYYSLVTTSFWWFKRWKLVDLFLFLNTLNINRRIVIIFPIFLFFISLLLLRLINGTKGFIFCARHQAKLDHKVMMGFSERCSVFGDN